MFQCDSYAFCHWYTFKVMLLLFAYFLTSPLERLSPDATHRVAGFAVFLALLC
jgi:hypothetical protein